MTTQDECYSSDDEVFVGPLTLKEIKKRFGVETHRQTPCAPSDAKENCDTSLNLLETKSEPDVASLISPMANATADYPSDDLENDSFLRIEKLVSEMEISTNSSVKEGLDNTLDVVNLILKQGSTCTLNSNLEDPNQICAQDSNENNDNRNNIMAPASPASQYCTPMKHSNPYENNLTPISKTKVKSPCFKTPTNRISPKPSTISKTPFKNKYQHIASPIAAYIKNNPEVPLVKNIHPKKPLPGVSSIPKLIKPLPGVSSIPKLTKPLPGVSSIPKLIEPNHQMYNKENINLPTLAYRSAKKVKVIEVSEKDKLPQNHSAKKLTSSLPKPLVLKHIHRELNSANKQIESNQEDSFADLTLHQADVSICTQKSAFKRPTK